MKTTIPAVLLALMLPAAAQAAETNPLLVPSGPTVPAGPLPGDGLRLQDLSVERRDLEHRDALGRLDPYEQRRLMELEAEQHRLQRVLTGPAEALPRAPSDAQLRDTLRPEPLPGSGYPPGRLGRGGATLKPGSKPGEKPGAGTPAPAPQKLGAPGRGTQAREADTRPIVLPETDRNAGGTRRYGFHAPAGDAGAGADPAGPQPQQ